MMARAPEDEGERLSLYPLTFEEAGQAALSVDPRKAGTDKEVRDGDRP